MPELVWKNYIDFEIGEEENDRARLLYEKLLDRTKHVKVWVSYAQFEESIGNPDSARAIYEKGYKTLVGDDLKEERVVLVDAWKEFEERVEGQVERVHKLMPRRVKRKRPLKAEDGVGLILYYSHFCLHAIVYRPIWAWRSTSITSSRTNKRRPQH